VLRNIKYTQLRRYNAFEKIISKKDSADENGHTKPTKYTQPCFVDTIFLEKRSLNEDSC
jgi:hypothetical protein